MVMLYVETVVMISLPAARLGSPRGGIPADDHDCEHADCGATVGSAGLPESDRRHDATLPLRGRRLQGCDKAAGSLPVRRTTQRAVRFIKLIARHLAGTKARLARSLPNGCLLPRYNWS